MRRIIVADDLTGASDAGVQFAKRGARTTVWLDPNAPLGEVESSDVVVVDMDSRASSPAAAYNGMRAFLHGLPDLSRGTIVKKMDSTLRGNLGAELRALLEARPRAFAIVCPAYPKNHRTVVDGRAFVAEVPVDGTDFARDLFSPVHDARVATHVDGASVLLSLRTVRAGAAALQAAIADARCSNVRIAVADAETDDDLRAIAALARVCDDLLWVGSAGLLEVLEEPRNEPAAAVPRAIGPVLLLVGSLSAMTQRQVAEYATRGVAVVLDPLSLLQDRPSVMSTLGSALRAFQSDSDVLIALDGSPAASAAALAYGGGDVHETSRLLRDALVAAGEPFLANRSSPTVVLSGGDVARAFCEAQGIRGMSILAETAPGVPISRAIGANLFLVTKAGGFGHPGTYRDILASLHTQVLA
ncbi:MAG: four-carbon acid sugar kinase family protein [Candidatus Velthaea sp.]